MTDLRQLLRELPVFSGDLPAFEPADTPGEPAGHARPAYRRTAGHWTKELLWT
ncbi:hypothetical protein ACH4NT_24380 [Streptomyces lydicus]|uniref:hypothetical protein n=1 Tax=Streptomyces lydicus TaxID=47763 RepID=UPI0037BD3F05